MKKSSAYKDIEKARRRIEKSRRKVRDVWGVDLTKDKKNFING